MNGAKECTSGTAYRTCSDNNADGCYEWGTSTNCGSGQYCSSGVCLANLATGSIRSPVTGALESVSTASACSGTKWCFDQNMIGLHAVNGGICDSDDTYAWDADLDYPTYDSDAGKPVYAIGSGVVADSYGGCTNAGGDHGQVLIQHVYNGVTWWSGYLHLGNIQVVKGQSVNENTIIGYVAATGTPVNHLHFVTYQGSNVIRGLVSFNTNIVSR